jgi:hypothetical protein
MESPKIIRENLENIEMEARDKPAKVYEVEIIDASGRGFMKCKADNVKEARKAGRLYIRQWNLSGAETGEIRLAMTKEDM